MYLAKAITEVLDVLKKHQQNINEQKDKAMPESLLALRKEKEDSRTSSVLLNNSKCDQIFISPESSCSESLNNRDLDSSFVGNT